MDGPGDLGPCRSPTVPAAVGVKAAGGIRTLASMLELVHAGASRIGTSSTMAIADEWRIAVPATDREYP